MMYTQNIDVCIRDMGDRAGRENLLCHLSLGLAMLYINSNSIPQYQSYSGKMDHIVSTEIHCISTYFC